MNKFLQAFRTSSVVVRFKVEGPINSKSEQELTQRLNRIQEMKSDALLVVVNSFGGSLQSAKNISARIKKIPVYCFAEQFCLNSANLILTAGTKCFAHKFSVVGDFGFVYEGIDTQGLEKELNVKEKHITSMSNPCSTNWFTQNIVPNDKKFIEKLLKQSEENLKQQILQNRQSSLNKNQQQLFGNFMETEGFSDAKKCVDAGLVDGITGIEEWILQNMKGKKIIEGTGKEYGNFLIDWVRDLRESFRYRAK